MKICHSGGGSDAIISFRCTTVDDGCIQRCGQRFHYPVVMNILGTVDDVEGRTMRGEPGGGRSNGMGEVTRRVGGQTILAGNSLNRKRPRRGSRPSV